MEKEGSEDERGLRGHGKRKRRDGGDGRGKKGGGKGRGKGVLRNMEGIEVEKSMTLSRIVRVNNK